MPKEHFIVKTPEEFKSVIDTILTKVQARSGSATCITLTGDLGAGKTTFTQELAKQLGVKQPVVSPTFGIMKSYQLAAHPDFDQLVHIDAYRIEASSEIGPLRLGELFSLPRMLVCVEWPERIQTILPAETIAVTIEIGEGEERIVQVE